MGQGDSKTAWEADSPGHEAAADYHQAWRAFALRRNVALLLLYGWLPACLGLFCLSEFSLRAPGTCVLSMGIWLGCALASVWWAGEFRCPRCRRRYAALGHRKGGTNLTRGLFDKVCANCKLRKFEGG